MRTVDSSSVSHRFASVQAEVWRFSRFRKRSTLAETSSFALGSGAQSNRHRLPKSPLLMTTPHRAATDAVCSG